MTVGCRFRANGDQVFVLGQPIDSIEEKIAVMLQTNPLILGETGIADYNETRGLVSLGAVGGDA